jgi:2-hydroxycyclohexanecarboxyl-CoA dehydrogenase
VLDFRDQVALVAGGASGIGAATASLLAELGAEVWVTDKDGARGAELVTQLCAAGAVAHLVEADLTDPSAAAAVVAEVLRASQRLDVAVHSVGWTERGRFQDQEPSFWQRVVDVNLMSALHLCHAVVPPMAAARYGRIVHVSSLAGRIGVPGEGVYAAAKAGVIGFTKSLAHEVAGDGIVANCVAPGATDTPLLHAQGADLLEKTQQVIPLRRLAEPGEQAAAIAFLASRQAAYITGQVLSVDGGLSMI